MRKHGMVLMAVAVAVVIAGVAEAGGRARVLVSQLPRQVTAGQAFELAITVVPETWSHARNVEPVITAECGERKIVTSAVALKRGNRYRASLNLPSAGNWTIRVDSRYCQTVMSPLAIEAVAASAEKAGKTPS